ncbi:TetR/AcrR family transcriptional regulator [Phytomonospora endophytica]|uniref:AcrR family transcriptional regulator n=1 Tax=Phytomonospora endophytica TaxID=714109 RepID=A0A841FXX0_9ACTN|nr:helix-turn-helix domain-containing protein [Phytomonospora endophytica]MBB6039573.1 AcrR family transcriptional regulator [Phytomonospora endophytica]GIG70539.1 hypothetical protein Pen01_68340 [Phytomonospora endophytica]
MRADGRRNRARVLQAAVEVFGANGTGASTMEVARRAGVGIATVFRHFPTKERLLRPVTALSLDDVAEQAAEALSKPDPAAAFTTVFGPWHVRTVLPHGLLRHEPAAEVPPEPLAYAGSAAGVGRVVQAA